MYFVTSVRKKKTKLQTKKKALVNVWVPYFFFLNDGHPGVQCTTTEYADTRVTRSFRLGDACITLYRNVCKTYFIKRLVRRATVDVDKLFQPELSLDSFLKRFSR